MPSLYDVATILIGAVGISYIIYDVAEIAIKIANETGRIRVLDFLLSSVILSTFIVMVAAR